ncbi:MAG: UPF0261 family protein [Chloroflexaceae bacterium]|nr:UPF0261 family protein [Chloroflexaceae bacterium]NJO07631.1 UPF0261 family protein [Chloroflexaceae bacterium]
MATVVLLGTMDTKGTEFDYVRQRVAAFGCDVILIDAGVMGMPLATADIPREQVAEAAGTTHAALVEAADRGAAIETMAQGATKVVLGLFEQGKVQGVMGVGGSSNSALATRAMQALPVGVPKLMVSTMAAGDTRPYVGAVDVTMMYSVVDIAGINRISERILTNAAAAIAGMAKAYAETALTAESKPLIGATMFGVTTPCVNAAREHLEAVGYEVLVFHATGTGGKSMEALATGGFLAGVLDATTTELADELVGGVLSAGPDRLEAAGKMKLPQVVSLGALDMVNFGAFDTVPPQFANRNLYKHNPTITLMRTTIEENAELGRIIARKLNQADGGVALFIPLKGVSLIATEGKPFYDPEADQALIDNLMANIDTSKVEVHQFEMDINDPRFAEAMATRLHELIRAGGK